MCMGLFTLRFERRTRTAAVRAYTTALRTAGGLPPTPWWEAFLRGLDLVSICFWKSRCRILLLSL